MEVVFPGQSIMLKLYINIKMHKVPDNDLDRAKEENWKKPKKDISIFL